VNAIGKNDLLPEFQQTHATGMPVAQSKPVALPNTEWRKELFLLDGHTVALRGAGPRLYFFYASTPGLYRCHLYNHFAIRTNLIKNT
jgi:uncharacterized protein YodC (DUF2158 family)